MENFAICCSLLGGFILSFGLLSLIIKERMYIAETVVATTYGMICYGLIGKDKMQSIKEHLSNRSFVFHFAHIVLSLQLVAVGVTVPKTFLKRNIRPILTLLLPVMVIMWGVSGAIVKYVCGLPDWPTAMVIGACVTPTDPILASAVLKGKFANKYIPSRLRHLLATESGANDGLGFPFLTLPIFLLKCSKNPKCSTGDSLRLWLYQTWLLEILVAIVIGILLGLCARILLKYSIKHLLIDKESVLVYALALAVLVTGITAFIGSDDLLAVFVSGVVFAWDDDLVLEIKNSHIMEVVDLIFNHSFFIMLGIILEKTAPTPRGLAAAILIVLFRRLPAVFLMKHVGLLSGLSTRETFFAGWFGPIGVGAIFFAHHAHRELTDLFSEKAEEIMGIVYLIVTTSIFVHGTTAPVIHLHLRHRQKKGRKQSDLYGSDTEAEKDIEMPGLRQIV